jgi:hypothetical protein
LWAVALNLNQLSMEGSNLMCDYSLAGIPNRLAIEGEQLVVHQFSTGSLGASGDIPEKRRRWMEELYSRMFVV